MKKEKEIVREFSTGAKRDLVDGKFDYEGHLSPIVLEAFAAYMHFHRTLRDGSTRDADNWQLGIPVPVYRSSLMRHVMDVWKYFRGFPIKENIVWALCGCLFNIHGMLFELLKKDPDLLDKSISEMESKRDQVSNAGRR